MNKPILWGDSQNTLLINMCHKNIWRPLVQWTRPSARSLKIGYMSPFCPASFVTLNTSLYLFLHLQVRINDNYGTFVKANFKIENRKLKCLTKSNFMKSFAVYQESS